MEDGTVLEMEFSGDEGGIAKTGCLKTSYVDGRGSHRGPRVPPTYDPCFAGDGPQAQRDVVEHAFWGSFQSHPLPQAYAGILPEGGQSPLSPVLRVSTSITVGPWQPSGSLQ